MSPATKKPARGSILRAACWTGAVAAVYPVFVLGFVYSQFFTAGLPGGRHGPADAYRHSLASAVVAYTLHPRCVDWVTAVMERDGRGSAARVMDAHNNRLGARIGAQADSWHTMRRGIADAVARGAINATSPEQITWLAPDAWQERLY